MLIHYSDRHDNESIRQIDEDTYRLLLQTETGNELATLVFEKSQLVDADPRLSEFDDCDVFFSDSDVRSGITTAEELLLELSELE